MRYVNPVAVLLAALLLSGCGVLEAAPKTAIAKSSGVIRDEKGAPITNAIVGLHFVNHFGFTESRELALATQLTKADGRFGLALQHYTALVASTECFACKKGYLTVSFPCSDDAKIVLPRPSKEIANSPRPHRFHGEFVMDGHRNDLMTECELDDAAFATLASASSK